MRLLGVLAVYAALSAPTAHAETATQHAQGYLDRAEAFWADRGAHLTCQPEVEWAQLDGPTAEAEIGGCRMSIDPAAWQNTPAPRERCLMILHEYGHLLGLTHDAGGIMAYQTVTYVNSSGEAVRTATFIDHPTKRCRFRKTRVAYRGRYR